jgi:hypothetical protein
MTQDEIIEMAKQAGWKDMKDYDSEMNESFFIGKFTDLKTFAKLVAQHERETCAKVCDDHSGWTPRMIGSTIRAKEQA